MRTRPLPLRRTLQLLLAGVLLVGAPLAQRDSAFMKDLRKAYGSGDRDRMAALVEASPHAAIEATIETGERIAEGSSDELEGDIDALSQGWRKAFDTRFVDKQYEYFSFLTGEYARSRKDLVERFGRALEQFESGNKARIPAAGMELQGLSAAFEEIGDLYMASRAAYLYAQCFEEEQLGRDADLRRVCAGLGRAMRLREASGLPESLYPADKERFEKLEYDGFGDPSKGPEARAEERMRNDPSFQPQPIGGVFELVEEIDAVERPYFGSDGIYHTWDLFFLGKEGSKASFPAVEDSPTVIRDSVAKAAVDVDNDGEGDVEFALTGTLEAVEFEFGSGDARRRWGFLALTGQDRDTYQGIQPFNLSPTIDYVMMFVGPGASIVGAIGETRIQVFDDNMDARYGSGPLERELFGLAHGSRQRDIDSILIGEEKRALPWSELVQIEDQWYKLESNEHGTDVIARKWEVETGTLKLDFDGPSVDYMVLRGEGNRSGVFVDVATNRRGVEVPIGSYELFVGRIGKGKRLQKMKALVLPGPQTPRWRVLEGETTEVELGEPFGFDFDFSQNDETITLKGTSIVVTGKAGETYQRLWNCVVHPEVSQREAGSRRGSKGEKMRPAGSQEEMIELGYDVVWFPFDLEIEKEDEDVEVQLVEKKNKLFGKIESEWKAE